MDSQQQQQRPKTTTGETTSSSSGTATTLPQQVKETVQSILPGSIGGATGSNEPPKEYISTNPEEITRLIFEKLFTMDNNMEYAHHLMKLYFDKDAKIVGAFPGQQDMNLTQYRQYFDSVKHAMPDSNCVCYDMAKGFGTMGKTVIFTRYVKLGRFAGQPLLGFQPTHSRVEERGVAFVRFNANNKIEYMELYPNDFEVLAYMGLNLYGKVPTTSSSLTGPQGLLAREPLNPSYPRTVAGMVTSSTESLMAHLPPKVSESLTSLRDSLNEAASSGKEEIIHLSNKVRELFTGVSPGSSSGSGTSSSSSTTTTPSTTTGLNRT